MQEEDTFMKENKDFSSEIEEVKKEIENLSNDLDESGIDFPSFVDYMKMRDIDKSSSGSDEIRSNLTKSREDNHFTDEEMEFFSHLDRRTTELNISCKSSFMLGDMHPQCDMLSTPLARCYKLLPDNVKQGIINHWKGDYKDESFKVTDREACIIRFIACEKEYPIDSHDAILDCLYKLQGSRSMDTDGRRICTRVLEDLVNHDWVQKKIFSKSVKEVKEGLESVLGQENAKRELLKCYTILEHTPHNGPYVVRIKGADALTVDKLATSFASSIGRYTELSCQNIGYDPEDIAGSSRIYCNSVPGELAEAIIKNNIHIIVMKNINDCSERNIARLSSFFENTFRDNFYRVQVPGNVLVICTESESDKTVPLYLFKNAFTVELSDYTAGEKESIIDGYVETFNHDFGLNITFDQGARKKLIEMDGIKLMRNAILNVYSEISLQNELIEAERVNDKVITGVEIQ